MISVRAGDKIKMTLIASTDDSEKRMSRGIESDSFSGAAVTDLVIGLPFTLDAQYGYIRTSPVKGIFGGMFTTENSTYSVEKFAEKKREEYQTPAPSTALDDVVGIVEVASSLSNLFGGGSDSASSDTSSTSDWSGGGGDFSGGGASGEY